jgi:hypothetical protein
MVMSSSFPGWRLGLFERSYNPNEVKMFRKLARTHFKLP